MYTNANSVRTKTKCVYKQGGRYQEVSVSGGSTVHEK